MNEIISVLINGIYGVGLISLIGFFVLLLMSFISWDKYFFSKEFLLDGIAMRVYIILFILGFFVGQRG